MNYAVKSLTLLIIVSLFLGCQSNDTGSTGQEANLEDYSIEKWDNDQSLAVHRDANDNVRAEGMLIDGRKEGTWIYYQIRNQFLDTIANYHKGVLNGPMLTFNRTGRLKTKCFYKDGLKHGKYIEFDYRALVREAEYKAGLLHGEVVTYYKNKNVRERSMYKNGKRNGVAKYFDEEGNLTMEYVFKDNERVSGGKVNAGETEDN